MKKGYNRYALTVAISGMPGALKSEVARHLAQWLEAPCLALSSFIPEVESAGKVIHPVDVGEDLNQKFGADHLAEKAIQSTPLSKVLVIDGPRHPGQLASLRRVSSLVLLIELDRPTSLRHETILRCTRDLPPIDPIILDEKNLRAGIAQLREQSDLVVPIGADQSEEIDRAAEQIRQFICSKFRDRFVEWLSDSGFGVALRHITELDQDAYVVGGALRDFLLGESAPRDLDVVFENDHLSAFDSLGSLLPQEASRHNSPRFILEKNLKLDAWTPAKFESGFKTIPEMLLHFDLTLHALALRLRDGKIVNPAGGLGDLNQHSFTIIDSRWRSSSRLEVARLCLRTCNLVARFGLKLNNPEIFAKYIGSIDVLSEPEIARRSGKLVLVSLALTELVETGLLSPPLALELRRHQISS